jgi:hypothetical protein
MNCHNTTQRDILELIDKHGLATKLGDLRLRPTARGAASAVAKSAL